MSLYEQWENAVKNIKTQDEYDKYWKAYFEKEKNAYEKILGAKENIITGTLSELAERFNMSPVDFTGFIDGINTSLLESIDLDTLNENSEIKLEIDFEKLYFNMLDAKADWLYNLPQWDDILSVERRQEITKEYRQSKIAVSNKVGRNDPCPCGSGKKYKKCCGKN
ncbi:SEC-C domain-containing protein [Clostridium thermosuccinogenes]|jgi:hypothetical protein|uniref:SEC-C domain-containing protein n=1 Tax=Clostridium thermosuccinogenes TaxID=84032 RepID=A0A2K2FN22_9CLOT|nr:SEC-C metal-binding domain-containing protein [Pseudoclostridium thermosuccinogenes]AUS97892.1 SEC-C domain-containing protein [Pseudoclostridium thermosuccinogenes]PNT94178.1 SEC-C domain-containing protein [Pseudoclostridium thermosuccinogenes]PNU00189.1 SEC-C domain-containing protein [Pseudoclostridium thermosuccinogenes]PNU01513.1 SEC-C domain-containing protein [Pseudoclostridium thermosuccinogenes]